MVADIYKTIQGILYYKLPKNKKGEVVVAGRIVVGWYLGDRDVHTGIPGIEIQALQTDPVKIAAGVLRAQHEISLKTYVRSDSTEVSEIDMQEFARLIYLALLPHRFLWLMPTCAICRAETLTPLHFPDAHPELAAPFLASAIADYTALWAETHPGGETLDGLTDSGTAAVAQGKLWEAVRTGQSVPNLDDAARKRILSAINEYVPPVRWLYDGEASKIDYRAVMEGQQLLHGGQFTLKYNENLAQPAFGPDDVPRDSR